MNIDLNKLEQLARAARDEGEKTGETDWYSATGSPIICAMEQDLQLIAAASPAVVLELVRRLRAAEAKSGAANVMLQALQKSVALADSNKHVAELLGHKVERPPAMQAIYAECVAAIAIGVAAQGASHD